MIADSSPMMQSALAALLPMADQEPELIDDRMSETVPAAEPAMDFDAEAEIDRRITSRIRGGQYAMRRQQREGRYGSLRQALLESPDLSASSGDLIQMIFSPVQPMQAPAPMMIEQQAMPQQQAEQMPRSALADLAEVMAVAPTDQPVNFPAITESQL